MPNPLSSVPSPAQNMLALTQTRHTDKETHPATIDHMAPTSEVQPSALGRALAGMTESVNIPKPRSVDPAQESYASIAAKSAPAKTGGLPTPPNSISPSLGPREAHHPDGLQSPPSFKDLNSDTDLEEAVEHAKAQDSPQKALIDRQLQNAEDPDAFGDITPYMLAKHHLPTILVRHGPLAIRHIMSYLTVSVPGFSIIPPAKARRLVVAALEGRGEDGLVGGLNSDVIFEKIGWGRWSAKKRGQMLRSRPKPAGLQIPQPGRAQVSQNGVATDQLPQKYQSMPERAGDRMSIDGTRTFTFEDTDVTDEEDWASIGAPALRIGISSFTEEPPRLVRNRSYQHSLEPKTRPRGITKRPSSNFAKSLPSSSVLYGVQQELASKESMDFSTFFNGSGKDLGSQDRAAVEALLQMSSV